MLASADDTRVRVWSLDPWQLRFEAHVPGHASAVGFDPQGRWFAAGLTRSRDPGDEDHTVRIWQVADGREIARLNDARGGAFDADGGFVSGDKRHAIEPAQLIEAACQRVERNLSLVEWRREIGTKEAHRTCPGLALPADDGRDWER